MQPQQHQTEEAKKRAEVVQEGVELGADIAAGAIEEACKGLRAGDVTQPVPEVLSELTTPVLDSAGPEVASGAADLMGSLGEVASSIGEASGSVLEGAGEVGGAIIGGILEGLG